VYNTIVQTILTFDERFSSKSRQLLVAKAKEKL